MCEQIKTPSAQDTLSLPVTIKPEGTSPGRQHLDCPSSSFPSPLLELDAASVHCWSEESPPEFVRSFLEIISISEFSKILQQQHWSPNNATSCKSLSSCTQPTAWDSTEASTRCSAWLNLSKQTHLLLATSAGFLLPRTEAAVLRGYNAHQGRSSCGRMQRTCAPVLIVNDSRLPNIVCQPEREAQPPNCHRFYCEDKLKEYNDWKRQDLCSYWTKSRLYWFHPKNLCITIFLLPLMFSTHHFMRHQRQD